MAKEEVTPDGKTQSPDGVEQKNDNQQKMYDADYVKQLISQRDEIKNELRTLKTQHETTIKTVEEEDLKRKGDYETLLKKVKDEREQERTELHRMVQKTFVNILGLKHGLLKPEYSQMFTAEFQVDGLEVKNAEDVEKRFEQFKRENPNLFNTEKKDVPKTDNQPPTTPKAELDKLSASELLKLGADEAVKRWTVK